MNFPVQLHFKNVITVIALVINYKSNALLLSSADKRIKVCFFLFFYYSSASNSIC